MTSSIRSYATAAQVKDKLAGLVNGYFTDVMIETEISRWEGWVDNELNISPSGAIVGGQAFTYSAAKSKHMIINAVVVCGAALGLCGPNIYSWNTLAQLQNAQNLLTYQLKIFMDQLQAKDETKQRNILDE